MWREASIIDVITICLKGIRCLDAPKGGEYNKYVIFLYHDGVAASVAFVNFRLLWTLPINVLRGVKFWITIVNF